MRDASAFTYVVDRVSVELLKAMRGVAHCDYSIWNDVGQIEVEVAVVDSPTITTDELADALDHCLS